MSELKSIGLDTQNLIDNWLEAERNGIQFPVPFDLAWGIAGYAMKHHGKRKLTSKTSQLIEGVDYITRSGESSLGGRSSEKIELTCDAFKSFCLLAATEEGRIIRQYFIETEKKWKLLEATKPETASEIEILHLKLEIAKQEAIAKQAEEKTIGLRHYVVTALPKSIADRILGVTTVTEIEVRDRVVRDSVVINDGSTINKTEICKRYSVLTKNGKPDYKRLNTLLDRLNLPHSAWEETDVIQTNRELKRDYLIELDRALYTAEERQLWLGE